MLGTTLMLEEALETIHYKGYTANISIFFIRWRDDIFLVYDHPDFEVRSDKIDKDDLYELFTREEENHLRDEVRDKEMEKEEESEKEYDEEKQAKMQKEIDELEEEIEDLAGKRLEREYYIFPVYAYIHSGVYLSLSNSAQGGGYMSWDTSLKGTIFADKNQFESEKDARQEAENIINDWNKILREEVFQVKIEETDNEEKNDVVGGVVGIENAREVAEEMLGMENEQKMTKQDTLNNLNDKLKELDEMIEKISNEELKHNLRRNVISMEKILERQDAQDI